MKIATLTIAGVVITAYGSRLGITSWVGFLVSVSGLWLIAAAYVAIGRVRG